MAIRITKNKVSRITNINTAEQFNALLENNDDELKDFFKEVLNAPLGKEVRLEEIKLKDGTYVPSNILLIVGGRVTSIHAFKVCKNKILYNCKVEKREWVYRENSKKEREKKYYSSRSNRGRLN